MIEEDVEIMTDREKQEVDTKISDYKKELEFLKRENPTLVTAPSWSDKIESLLKQIDVFVSDSEKFALEKVRDAADEYNKGNELGIPANDPFMKCSELLIDAIKLFQQSILWRNLMHEYQNIRTLVLKRILAENRDLETQLQVIREQKDFMKTNPVIDSFKEALEKSGIREKELMDMYGKREEKLIDRFMNLTEKVARIERKLSVLPADVEKEILEEEAEEQVEEVEKIPLAKEEVDTKKISEILKALAPKENEQAQQTSASTQQAGKVAVDLSPTEQQALDKIKAKIYEGKGEITYVDEVAKELNVPKYQVREMLLLFNRLGLLRR